MTFSNFPKIIKRYLADLPQNDYPVLDTFTLVSCGLGFSFDQKQEKAGLRIAPLREIRIFRHQIYHLDRASMA